MPVRAKDESGFTMLVTTIAMAVVMLLTVVAVTAVTGDSRLSRRDLEQKRAFEAAKSGIDDYAYHLTANSRYWSECAGVATPNAVNQEGSTEKRLAVPGETGATYAIELLHVAGKTKCDSSSVPAATESMIESKGSLPGSFRIRSTGYAGEAKSSLVATFKPPSFLDYVYFTQLETLDPITFGLPNPSPELEEAYKQCELTYQQGRYSKPFKVKNAKGEYENEYCSVISFVTGDYIKGPLHTNDAIIINGTPTFGRSPQDQIEVGAEKPGWYGTSGSKPNFVGNFVTSAGEYKPKEINVELPNIAQPAFKYTGQVKICLSGNSMTVGNNGTCTGVYSGPIPSNGVVYVKDGTGCNEVYSPFTAVYPETSECGNAYVSGEYTGQLTIAAENDVIINGPLVRSNESGLLGLIARNFVRLYHPCNSKGENLAGSLKSPTIDAAMLAIKHSIIVDHYDCGEQLGTLEVEGALAQKFRGPVGTSGSSGTGYLKNYVYDNRLRFQEPPYFIEPEAGNWVIGRETAG